VNVLLLAIAFRAWSGSARSVFLRVMAAIAAFSVEIQIATWLHAGNIRSVRLINLGAAAIGVSWHAYRRASLRGVERDMVEAGGSSFPPADPSLASAPVDSASTARVPPLTAVGGLVLLITILAAFRPVVGADPYHLHRVDQITGTGTLAYDAGVPDIKVNALAGVYELLLADLRIPGTSAALVRLHGLLGLGFYLLAIAAVAPWAGIRRRWLLLTILVVPVVFHQLVLVKNDLFGAVPAFVALAWVVLRGPAMSLAECAAAAALAGFGVGIKISSAFIALVVAAFLAVEHRGDWKRVATSFAAASAGAIAGGLLFTLIENHLVYGGALQPYLSLGNRHEHVADAAIGFGRFALSLVDLGTVTPRVWPGRRGWGSTFGLPLVWALVVLALRWRDAHARRALLAAGACLFVFGATYPDADVAHRMVIAPGLLLIVVALGCLERDERYAPALRTALIAVIALSALQVGRSAWLYLR
jgi:hypothetical protein